MGVELPEIVVSVGNIIVLVATILAGGFALVKPAATMRALQLSNDGGTAGMSELRAASGGLFVAISIAALLIDNAWPAVMVGVAYVGAGTGRLTSILLDKSGSVKIWLFFAWEALFALWLLVANIPRL
jgi:hypothetical protein